MKVVDTREYVSILKSLCEDDREVSMVVAGNSMVPFLINGRDTVTFRKCDRGLRVGDIVFYQRFNGQYIMHRICQIKSDGYYIVGDAQTQIEGPILKKQIFAVITKVHRKGRWIGPEDFCWKFFQYIWIRLIPLRPFLMKVYGCWHRIKERK